LSLAPGNTDLKDQAAQQALEEAKAAGVVSQLSHRRNLKYKSQKDKNKWRKSSKLESSDFKIYLRNVLRQ
jgi:hypothetical protein